MRLAFHTITMLFAVSGYLVADEPKQPRTLAAMEAVKSFAGSWDLIKVQPEGVTKSAAQLVFRTDWTYSAVDKDGKELWAGTFDLDPTAKPKIWDHRANESVKKNEDVLGIYDLQVDTLKLSCVAGVWKDKTWKGKPRPKLFQLEGADVYLELRRAKSGKP